MHRALAGRGSLSGIATGLYNNADGSPILALIGAATKTLDMEIYTMDDQTVRDAIRSAMACGVTVRIVKEPQPDGDYCQVFGAASTESDCQDQQSLVSEVNSAGGQYVAFNKTNLCPESGKSCYEHGKIAIADSSVGLISTGNFDPTSLCDVAEDPSQCNRDYSVITTDSDIITSFENIIGDDLKGETYNVADDITPAAAPKVTVSPISLQPIENFVASAKHTLQIQNQYLEDADWNRAIETSAKSGVQVQVNVESFCNFGTPTAGDVKEDTSIFTGFDSAGVTSRIFNKNVQIDNHQGYLHAKTMVADGTSAWVGSVNGSTTALQNNREFGLFLADQASISKLAGIMTGDFDSPNEETWQQSLDCAENN